MTMIKTAAAATLAVLTLSAPASATVFSYDATIGNGIGDTRISVDSVAGTAKLSGTNIDLTLSGDSFRGFDGVAGLKRFKTDAVTGTFTRNGKTYDAFHSISPKHTSLTLGNDYSFLWTYGNDAAGTQFDFDGKGNLTHVGTTTGGGNTGGNTGGGTGGGNTGGGSVPAPGPLGLLAAMALFGTWRRRRAVAA